MSRIETVARQEMKVLEEKIRTYWRNRGLTVPELTGGAGFVLDQNIKEQLEQTVDYDKLVRRYIDGKRLYERKNFSRCIEVATGYAAENDVPEAPPKEAVKS